LNFTYVEAFENMLRNAFYSLTADRSTTELRWIVFCLMSGLILRRGVCAANDLVAGAGFKPAVRGCRIMSRSDAGL